MAQVDIAHPNAWGRVIPFVATNPAGDLVPWDGDDLHIEFRNTHSASVTVRIRPYDVVWDADNVGPFFVPERTFTVEAGVDASFFFDKEFSSAYVNEQMMLRVDYVDGHEDLLIRPVTMATAAGDVQDAAPQTVEVDIAPAATLVFPPNLFYEQRVTPNFMTSATIVRQPTVDFQRILRPNFIAATGGVFSPTLIQEGIVVPTLIGPTATIFNHTVVRGNVNVTPTFTASTSVVYEPLLSFGGVVVSPNFMTSTSVVYQPTVIPSQFVEPNYLAAASVIYSPEMTLGGIAATPDFIAAATVIYGPTAVPGNKEVALDFLPAATTIYDPTVLRAGQAILPDYLPSNEQVFSPTVVRGNVNIAPTFIAASSAVFSPAITVGNVNVTPDLISSPTVVYSPTVSSGTYIEDVFSAYPYLGTGAAQSIVNGKDLAGDGGMVWVKNRGAVASHILVDSARGQNHLQTNNTGGQGSSSATVSALNSDGFSLGTNSTVNSSGVSYISWSFLKAAKFFDVVTYTGNGANRTIAHNLGVAPGMIIVKRTDTSGTWIAYHRSQGGTKYLFFSSTNAVGTSSVFWNNTDPTSSVFSIGTDGDVNASGGTYVAYLFAHDAGAEGLIQCGSFLGTGVEQDISLGWEAQYVLYKRTNTTGSWNILDTSRQFDLTTSDKILLAENSGAEATVSSGNPHPSGFTIIGSASDSYIYMAIRKGLMRPPTDATKVFAINARTGTGATATVSAGGITTGVDFTIHKNRGGSNTTVFDRLRGPTVRLIPNLTNAEGSESGVTAFNPADVTLGTATNQNVNGGSFINYLFKQARGFLDIVSYVKDATTTQRVAHNLGVAPELIFNKNRGAAEGWYSYIGSKDTYIQLQSTAAQTTVSNSWGSSAPTAADFGVSTTLLTSSANYVAYLFATLAGVSKVGTYTGNGSVNQINCGFSAGARFVLIKHLGAAGTPWYFWDSVRGIVSGNDPYLLMNTTAAEVATEDYIDPYSAGFELTGGVFDLNSSGANYLFLAIA